jgi:hypothetical protein
MDATDASEHAARPNSPDPLSVEATAGDQPLGPDAVSILASESWSLLATRSMLWNDRMSRTTTLPPWTRRSRPPSWSCSCRPPPRHGVVVVAAGAIAFPVVWGALFSLNARTV